MLLISLLHILHKQLSPEAQRCGEDPRLATNRTKTGFVLVPLAKFSIIFSLNRQFGFFSGGKRYNISIRISQRKVIAMKDIRLQFSDEEYRTIKNDADRLQISVRQLVHDRAAEHGCTLCKALILSAETTRIRDVLNQIIRRETAADLRLYEDDMIRLERIMAELEQTVTRYVSGVLKEVRTCGNPAV